MEDMTWEHSTFVLVGVPNVEQPRVSHLHARISYASNADMIKPLRFALTCVVYLVSRNSTTPGYHSHLLKLPSNSDYLKI
jgi:hypothetical protein